MVAVSSWPSLSRPVRRRRSAFLCSRPRSPKLNGHVERAQRTHTEEFHDRYMGDLQLTDLNKAMREWEYIYNHIRPHYSLALKTPTEYLAEYHQGLAPAA